MNVVSKTCSLWRLHQVAPHSGIFLCDFLSSCPGTPKAPTLLPAECKQRAEKMLVLLVINSWALLSESNCRVLCWGSLDLHSRGLLSLWTLSWVQNRSQKNFVMAYGASNWCLISLGRTWQPQGPLIQRICIWNSLVPPEKRNDLVLQTIYQNLPLCCLCHSFTLLAQGFPFYFCFATTEKIHSPTALAKRTWWRWTYKKNISSCTLLSRGNGHWH